MYSLTSRVLLSQLDRFISGPSPRWFRVSLLQLRQHLTGLSDPKLLRI